MGLELIADYGCHVGEGPLWDPARGLLYWADILTGPALQLQPRHG